MCKLMEDKLIDNENQVRSQFVADLLAMEKLTYEEIAKATRLTVADVEGLKN